MGSRYHGNKFETYGETQNVFYFSGYDASIIAFLTGRKHQEAGIATPKTDVELFEEAVRQELLDKVIIE